MKKHFLTASLVALMGTGVTAQEKLGSKINDTVLSLATCTKCINFSN